MTKGEQTRETILELAAEAFNRHGYSGTSLSDIMALTGLEKGGIYNHFQSKEDLAVQAFDYAFDRVSRALLTAVRQSRSAEGQLRGMIDFFLSYYQDPPVAGGCPVLNTAVESDDAYPALRARARAAMDEWRKMILHIVDKGKAKGEFRADVEPEELTSLLLASLEGGIMMSKLYNDPAHTQRVVALLNAHLDDHVIA